MTLKIWQIGNNGMRNAYRLQSGLLAYAKYPKIGHIGNHRGAGGKDEEIAFTEYLNKAGIIDADLSKNDGTHARKWRYVAQKMGFIFPPAAEGHTQEELGDLNTFTPSGKAFLECKSQAAIYDCFLRSQIVATEPALYKVGAFFSPIRYVSAVLLELEKINDKVGVTQIAFDTILQTSDPTIPPAETAMKIARLEDEESKATSKKVFKKRYIESLDYPLSLNNFQDYGNTNRRYFLLTGLFEKDGKGLKIADGKKALVELIAYGDFVSDEQNLFDNQLKVCNVPPLPTDNKDIALTYYKHIIKLAKGYHIQPDKSTEQLLNSSAHDINIVRYDLEDRIFEAKEDIYAKAQPDASKEIDGYLTLIQKNKGGNMVVSGNEISIPSDQRPAYLEWIAWRAFLAIDHITNSAAQARHFHIDSEMMPTGTAGGGDCDVLIECGELVFVIEVTLTTGSRQESAETESVRRHVSDIMRENPNKNVVGVFLANEIASETYNTFKNESYIFDDDVEYHPHILPLTIAQFQTVFKYLFRDGKVHATPQNFLSVYSLLDKNKSTFKAWREHIAKSIDEIAQTVC